MSLDFLAIDVETANNSRGSICSIGYALVNNGVISDTGNLLCRPPGDDRFFSPFNIAIHGITWSDVSNEPSFIEVQTTIFEKFDHYPWAAHNAAFDFGAIRDGCKVDNFQLPALTYACSLVMSRARLKLMRYSLPFVCEALGIEFSDHHNAEADAIGCASVIIQLAKQCSTDDLAALATELNVGLGQIQGNEWRGCRKKQVNHGNWNYGAPPSQNTDADQNHILYGKHIVFTGELTSQTRTEAWAKCAAIGAIPEKGVTKRTDFLVIGDGFVGDSPREFHTGKAKKAADLHAKGHHLEVLNEQDFLIIISESLT